MRFSLKSIHGFLKRKTSTTFVLVASADWRSRWSSLCKQKNFCKMDIFYFFLLCETFILKINVYMLLLIFKEKAQHYLCNSCCFFFFCMQTLIPGHAWLIFICHAVHTSFNMHTLHICAHAFLCSGCTLKESPQSLVEPETARPTPNHLTTMRANHSGHEIRQAFLPPGHKSPVKGTLRLRLGRKGLR